MNHEKFSKIICKRCKHSMRNFNNQCKSPECCMYLDDEFVKEYDVPKDILESKRKLLNEYSRNYGRK